jgi:hypothetical protein
MNRILIILVLLFAFPAYANAEWTVHHNKDAITDAKTYMAYVMSTTGELFYLTYEKSGSLYALLDIKNGRLGEEPPIYRFDKKPPHKAELEVKKAIAEINAMVGGTEEPIYIQTNNAVYWRVQKGGEKLPNPFIDSIKKGNELLIRYSLFSGGTKDALFSLKGSSKALNNIMKLNQAN